MQRDSQETNQAEFHNNQATHKVDWNVVSASSSVDKSQGIKAFKVGQVEHSSQTNQVK